MSVASEALYNSGAHRAAEFCKANDLPPVGIVRVEDADPISPTRFGVCAYYRAQPRHPQRLPAYAIVICVEACAGIGRGGRAWSYPGYVVDRTPYGVIQHELGHHVDWCRSRQRGSYSGDFSRLVHGSAAEPAITGYAPNPAEWFAEMMRLFITNPGLLALLRPRTHHLLIGRLMPVETQPWEKVLTSAPERTLAMARKKIREVQG